MASTTPRVLFVGPLSLDLFADGAAPATLPGGSVSYAARTAAAFGERLAILTIGGPDANVDALAGHEVEIVNAAATLAFEFHAVGGRRQLRVLRRPGRPLGADDLPGGWRQPRLLILAPLLPDDIDLPSFAALPARDGRAVLAQGLQRELDESSVISHLSRPSSALLDACTSEASVFLSDEEISGWTREDLDAVARRTARVVVTRGAAGADIYYASQPPRHVDACAATAVDTTGAGDVFATAFMLALHEGEAAAARLASACAAAAVEQRGPAPLPARAQIAARVGAAAKVEQR